MTSPENFPENTSETTGNIPRGTAEKRGEETIEAIEYSDAMKRLEALKKRLAELETKEGIEQKPAPAEEGPKEVEMEYTEADFAEVDGPDGPNNPNDPDSPDGPNNPNDPDDPDAADDDPEDSGEAESAPSVAETEKKARGNHALRNILIATTAVVLAGVIGFGASGGFSKKGNTPAPTITTTVEKDANENIEEFIDEDGTAAEQDRAHLKYNYDDYARFDEKTSHNAYGTSRIDCYGDDDKTSAEFMRTAEDMPEALASYRGIFFEDEQKELGIYGMTDKQLDDYLSDVDSEESAVMQQKLLSAMSKIIADKENGKWEFNLENSAENSHYVIWNDANEDGIMTPDEMHLGYSVVSRSNAPQANYYRKDKNGNWVKMLDLNLYCRFQPNTPADEVPDLPFIPEEEVTPTPTDEPTPTPTNIPTPEVTPNPTPIPTPIITPEPKNEENLVRIDEKIEKDIEEDIHTQEIVIPKTEDVTKVEENIPEPVVPNPEAQAEADRNEIPIEEAPGTEDIGGQELNDILADLGIY